MPNIFVIDDDIHIGDLLEEVLVREGYQVTRAYSGTEAMLALSARRPDLVLLDLMLPGLSGEEVLSRLQGIPVIVVSAKVDVSSKVQVLLNGAADYVTKPFAIRELLARIQVQLRKTGSEPQAAELQVGDLLLDPLSHQVTVQGQTVRLTKTEYAILKLLMKNPQQVIAKSVILERISADTPDCTESSLKQHVSNLRKKLRSAGGRDYIEAVWGIGFKLAGEF